MVAGWPARTQAGPVDKALLEQASTAMAAVAAPSTDVVAILGSPTGSGSHRMGDGGLAVTRFRAGRPSTVVFAQAALTGLSSAALHSPAAHELAHLSGRDCSLMLTGRHRSSTELGTTSSDGARGHHSSISLGASINTLFAGD